MIKRSFIFLIAAFMVLSAASCKSKETSVSYSSKDIFQNTGAVNISSIKMNHKDQLIAYAESGSNAEYAILKSDEKPVKKIKLDIEGSGNVFTFDKSNNS